MAINQLQIEARKNASNNTTASTTTIISIAIVASWFWFMWTG